MLARASSPVALTCDMAWSNSENLLMASPAAPTAAAPNAIKSVEAVFQDWV